MESKTNYTMVGFIVLFLVGGLITTCLWLSVSFDQNKYSTYVVYLSEAVSGLTEDSIVKYNGVKIGEVGQIELSHFNPQHVKVYLKIIDGTPITTGTVATLITQGITGVTSIGLLATTPSLEPLQKKPGEMYPVIPYKASLFNKLEQNFDDISLGIQRMLTKENAVYVHQSLENIQRLSDVFAKNQQNINQSLRELPILIHDLTTTVRVFKGMILDAKTASQQVTMTMKSGRNSINKISQQFIPPATEVMRRMEVIAANLEKVSAELRQNPAVIIRGQTLPKLGPGE